MMNRQIYKLIIALLLFPFAISAQVDITLTIANKEIVGNELFFDVFLSTKTANPLYLADSDFVIRYDNSAFSNPSFSKVSDPSAPIFQFGFLTVNREQASNDILDDVFKAGVYQRLSTELGFTGEDLIINYLGSSPNSQSDLEQNVPFIDQQAFAHSLGRFKLTNVINPTNALNLEWTQSAIIPTDIFGYDPNATGIPAVRANLFFDDNNALPLDLLRFEGWAVNDSYNHLIWETASEVNVSHYEIERSADGSTFRQIGTQIALGNNLPGFQYEFDDLDPIRGINYYRLHMVDEDGTSSYSDLITIDWKSSGTVSIFPIPAVNELTLEFNARTNDLITMSVFDGSGKLVFNQSASVTPGSNQIPLSVRDLAAGHYFIQVLSQNSENQHAIPFTKVQP